MGSRAGALQEIRKEVQAIQKGVGNRSPSGTYRTAAGS